MAVIARFFGPEDFGVVAFLTIILAICDVFIGVSFSDVIIARADIKAVQLSTLYWINIGTAFVLYAILFLFAPLSKLVIESPYIVDMVRLMGLTMIIGCTSVQFAALARKELRFRFLTIAGILQSLVAFVVAVVCVSSGFGVWSIIYSSLAAQALMSVMMLLYARENNWLPSFCFNFPDVTEHLKFGVFRIGAALLNNINSRSDQIAILLLLGPVPLGYYSLAYNIAMKPFQNINPILTKISFPIFANVSESRSLMRSGYRKGFRLLLLINAPLLLGYIAVAPLVIPMFLGPDWDPVIIVSQILAVYALFRSAANINIGLILANGKYRWPFYWNLLLFFLVPGSIFWVSKVSESVVVVSCVLVVLQMGLFAMGYLLFVRKLLGSFGKAFITDFLGPVSAALIMSVAVSYLREATPILGIYLQLVLLVGVGGLVYLAASMITQRGALKELGRIVFPREKPSVGNPLNNK